MVNYPNMSKKTFTKISNDQPKKITTHRGMNLEEDISLTNKYYLDSSIALIYKKPTPVQIVKVDYPRRASAKIVEAYYKIPSTTDYNGIYKGKYIDFEAKETKAMTFPFQNIHKHQVEHLKKVLEHGGIAFVILAFTSINEVYLIDATHIVDLYYHSQRKSMTYKTVQEIGHLIPFGYIPRLDYLKVVEEIYFKEEL